ncbi:hypothetical protein [Brevibacillus fulvus]|uniref:Uncharacterized protein n=1 Tax=Brevibacillus fulvus TaxID=1125967 RepID=A0A938Y349_9BACL|nr:hypothetical protein [Brevibacillus fulvus]MBM7592303.1 hypothetical protein [Brevibacillus fulvus]
MFNQVKQFVDQFRELEKQGMALTEAEQDTWKRLKEKLTAASDKQFDQPHRSIKRVIAIASFYPQAGASFLAGNFSYCQAEKSLQTVLCELPEQHSYFYFALDSESRSTRKPGAVTSQEQEIRLLNGRLRVRVFQPEPTNYNSALPELMNWFLQNSRDPELLIIDLSSHWRGEAAEWIMGVADEVWFVLDADFSRLSRLVLTESPPAVWKEGNEKIKVIANRWNAALSDHKIIRKIEGTLSFWSSEPKGIHAVMPHFEACKVSEAQLAAQLFLERYPDESVHFDKLARF